MRLLALDLSLTASGVVDPDGNADTLRPPKGVIDRERLAWWHQTFVVLLDQHKPTRIAIEQPFSRFPSVTAALNKLYGQFDTALVKYGRPVVITWVPPTSLKLKWAGSGKADKLAMRAAAITRLGKAAITDLDDNAIDALALWHTTRLGYWDNPAGDAA
jgi:Holliday junction resolvasome RuvABC endonuclease subunit